MAGKAGLPANEGAVDAEEPGAMDNRISWTPSDFPATEAWEDGMTYKVSEFGKGVTVRQISPGEGELIPPPQPEEAEEEAAPAPRKRGGGYGNPAIEDMANEA